jgi:hypothetical protein
LQTVPPAAAAATVAAGGGGGGGARSRSQSYGPNFSYREYARPRNWLHGVLLHYGLSLLVLVIVTPPLKALARRLFHAPGDGPDAEAAARDEIEFRGIAEPDIEGPIRERAFGRCWYKGSMYYCKFPRPGGQAC